MADFEDFFKKFFQPFPKLVPINPPWRIEKNEGHE